MLWGQCRVAFVWIILQVLFTFTIAEFPTTPYVSKFGYSPDNHPFRNPRCFMDDNMEFSKSEECRSIDDENCNQSNEKTESSIEVRAMLLPCSKTQINDDQKPNENQSPPSHSFVKNCRKKIVIDIKFVNVGKTMTREQFIVVDHVIDPMTQEKSRLLQPLVVKIQQEQILQLYKLKFQSVINAEATEEVINNKLNNFTGCDDYSSHPTCGRSYYHGLPVPFSQGFCCACNQESNIDPPESKAENCDKSKIEDENYSMYLDSNQNIRKLNEDEEKGTVFIKDDDDIHENVKSFVNLENDDEENAKLNINLKNKFAKRKSNDPTNYSNRIDSGFSHNLNFLNKMNKQEKRNRRNNNYWNKKINRRTLMNVPIISVESNEDTEAKNVYYHRNTSNTYCHLVKKKPTFLIRPQSKAMRLSDLNNAARNERASSQPTIDCKADKSAVLWEKFKIGSSANKNLSDLESAMRLLSNISKEGEETVIQKVIKPCILIESFKITNFPQYYIPRRKLQYLKKQNIERAEKLGDHFLFKGQRTLKEIQLNPSSINLLEKLNNHNRDKLKISLNRNFNVDENKYFDKKPYGKRKRSENLPKDLKISHLFSGEMPPMDTEYSSKEKLNSDKIRPWNLDNDKTFSSPFSETSSNIMTKKKPVNLKIIGLISMEDSTSENLENNCEKPHEQSSLENPTIVVPLINVNVEQESSSQTTTPEKPELTTIAITSSSLRCNLAIETVESPGFSTTKQNIMNTEPAVFTSTEFPDTVTFIVDTDDDDDEKTAELDYLQKQNEILPKSRTNLPSTTSNHHKMQYSKNENSLKLKNMLSILKFIDKLKNIAKNNKNQDSKQDIDTVLKMQRLIIIPNDDDDDNDAVSTDKFNEISPCNTFSAEKLTDENRSQNSVNNIKSPKETLLQNVRRKLIEKYRELKKNKSNRMFKDRSLFHPDNIIVANRRSRSRKSLQEKAQRMRKKNATNKRRIKNRKKKRKRKKKKKKEKKKPKKKKEALIIPNANSLPPFKRQLMSFIDYDRMISIENNILDDQSVKLPEKWLRVLNEKENQSDFNEKKKSIKKSKNKRKKKKKKRMKIGKKLYVNRDGIQVRGGQNCMDRKHPPNIKADRYLESAHCLRFSDLWYSVYDLEDPVIEHTVNIQLFKKETMDDGTIGWQDLTQGKNIRLGTFLRHQRDSEPTISFIYSEIMSPNKKYSLDPKQQKLFIPVPSTNTSSNYRDEYMMIPSNGITRDGKECDKAGVGYAAFVKQKDRCSRKRDSCLRNQPFSYWRHDMDAQEAGHSGCYFLSNFAEVPSNPIKYNITEGIESQYLGLEYHLYHMSTIGIEVRDDNNAIVSSGESPSRLTEIHIDSTSPHHTILTVIITNIGLVSSEYQVRLIDCPAELPTSWSIAISLKHTVPPQQDCRIVLDLPGQLFTNTFHCNVEVINYRGELLAVRRIRVQKMNRCFCLWHCICSCGVSNSDEFSCEPMTLEHYHNAGFRGPVPAIILESSALIEALLDILTYSLLILFCLLLFGVIKLLLGTCFSPVAQVGLNYLLDNMNIGEYIILDDDNSCDCRLTTEQKFHKACNSRIIIFLNIFYFFIYPVVVFRMCLWKIQYRKNHKSCCNNESKISLIDQAESSQIICVTTYGISQDSILEMNDTSYVIEELKKSRESLQDKAQRMKTELENEK